MAYRKIEDGGEVFVDKVNTIEQSEAVNSALPMTYIACPICKSKLFSCECRQIINYYCKCGWKHVNHLHDNRAKDRDVNYNSIITKNIRK